MLRATLNNRVASCLIPPILIYPCTRFFKIITIAHPLLYIRTIIFENSYISAGCPKVTHCPVPVSLPVVNGDLSADIRQLEAALVACGLQIDAVKQCQEQQDAKT